MTTSELLLAPQQLCGCLFAAVHRDTRGADLAPEDRLNHFPASVLVAVSLISEGEIFLLPPGCDWRRASDQPALQRLTVTGPTDLPMTSWAAGGVRATTFAFYPDAWRQLGGAKDYSDIPASIAGAIDRFEAAGNSNAGWAAFCNHLTPIWAKSRAASWPGAAGISDWTRSLTARVALSTRGRSLRAFERRLKRLSGHSRRTLAFHAAFENLHRISRRHAGEPLAEIAAEAGYADQSHMGRAVRRATGFSPAYLNRAIETEEAFWCYRLLGERF